MYRFKTKPFKHQLDCFELSKDKKYFAFLMEMGTGKSKVAVDTAAYMFDQGWIDSVLIFANKGSYLNWADSELPTHMPEHIQYQASVWKANMGKAAMSEFEKAFKPFDGMKVMLMNIEALAYERSSKVAMSFARTNSTLCIVDESTMIKNPKAKRTKTAIKIGAAAKARRILTGSLVDNNPLDAYAQFEFLDKSCLGFSSFYSFRNQFADLIEMHKGNRSFKVVRGFKNLNNLKDRIGKYAFSVKKADCLDLPPKIYQKFEVELTPEQKKMYDDLVRKSLSEVAGETVSVKVVLTKLLKLHQLVCGHVKDDEGNVHEVKSNRIEALKSILEETTGQVIIWCNYRQDIHNIEKELKSIYGKEQVQTYYGDTTDDERSTAKAAFRLGAESELRFLIANPATGGYGLTLTGATTHVYYSNNFDAEKRNQSEDRSHRIGQTNRVTYIDIVAPGTIDEKIINALRRKKSLADEITETNWKEMLG